MEQPTRIAIPQRLAFKQNPTFAELWEAATRQMHKPRIQTLELMRLLRINGLKKETCIIADVAAGSGINAIPLRKNGFWVECFDISDDQIKLFRKNARLTGVSNLITKSSWLELPKYVHTCYDLILCRGNSFIYAPGGWNSDKYDKDRALQIYLKTLETFYDLLAEDGILYIDKFPDNEQDHKVKVAEVVIGGKTSELFFFTKLEWGKKERYGSMVLRDSDGKETGAPNKTYALSAKEFKALAREAGFTKIDEPKLWSETIFDVFLLKK
jgi:ubiquinone/menaquinone biosynthesis C-methylase UbiE